MTKKKKEGMTERTDRMYVLRNYRKKADKSRTLQA